MRVICLSFQEKEKANTTNMVNKVLCLSTRVKTPWLLPIQSPSLYPWNGPTLIWRLILRRYSMDGIHWWKLTRDQLRLTDELIFINKHMRAILPSPRGMEELCLSHLRGQFNSTTQPTACQLHPSLTLTNLALISQHSTGF